MVQQVDDNALFAAWRRLVQGLRQQDGRGQVGVHVGVQGADGESAGIVVCKQRCVVHDTSHGPKFRLHLRQQLAHGVFLGQVAGEGVGAPAQRNNFRDEAERFIVRRAVMHGNIPAVARQAQGDGATDAARGARDEGDAGCAVWRCRCWCHVFTVSRCGVSGLAVAGTGGLRRRFATIRYVSSRTR